MGRQGLY
ncbi:hypothetical protein GQ600_26337 [Phytophthora cactorum]|nr:hypothetical protein GQ600_26337 [Phytophthora cactorum]